MKNSILRFSSILWVFILVCNIITACKIGWDVLQCIIVALNVITIASGIVLEVQERKNGD